MKYYEPGNMTSVEMQPENKITFCEEDYLDHEAMMTAVYKTIDILVAQGKPAVFYWDDMNVYVLKWIDFMEDSPSDFIFVNRADYDYAKCLGVYDPFEWWNENEAKAKLNDRDKEPMEKLTDILNGLTYDQLSNVRTMINERMCSKLDIVNDEIDSLAKDYGL